MYTRRLAAVAIIAGLFLALRQSENMANPEAAEVKVKVTIVETERGPQVQVAFGDVTLQADEFTVKKANKVSCTVQPVDGMVQLQHGGFQMQAKAIESRVVRGLFSEGVSLDGT